MKSNISKEFSNYLESTFNKKFNEKLKAETVPEDMRNLLEKEGALIAREIVITDKNADSIEELIELLFKKHWDGILTHYTKTA